MISCEHSMDLAGIETLLADCPLVESTSDGLFRTGRQGVRGVRRLPDGKAEFVVMERGVLAGVLSSMGYPAYYPLHPPAVDRPVRAVLMDLDGTSVRSEGFWVWIIEQTIGSLRNDPRFRLSEADMPHVSGHSVSEHLQYGIRTYCPGASLEAARAFYFQHTRREMQAIVEGKGRSDAFTPTPGLRDFLLGLKARKIKIGLVTSGLYEKAWPEILSAFRTLELGDPKDFYDAIITAGHPLGPGLAGTLGELSPKPHPWLYAETARVGLGIPFSERARVVGLEDSAAGILSVLLAGFSALGLAGGNIVESGCRRLCAGLVDRLDEALQWIDGSLS